MKNLTTLSILVMLLTMTSCELVGDIFSAGFYTALILVVLVIAIIAFVIIKIRRK
jgi:hypothetical protein